MREGFARLAPLGLSFDAWMYHTQLGELVDLARAFPETPIVLDHVGGPIGLGPYAGRRDEVFAEWKARIGELAACPNVCIKLGGLGMRMFGFDVHLGDIAPSSEQLAAAWRPYVETCIAAFGVERAMFESNFPVDKGSCGYQALWNAMKRIAANYSAAEKAALFSGTATRFYRLLCGRRRSLPRLCCLPRPRGPSRCAGWSRPRPPPMGCRSSSCRGCCGPRAASAAR